MMSTCAKPIQLWSAVTGHRLHGLADLSAKQSSVQRLAERIKHQLAFDGDKSPAESGVKSPHSKDSK